MIAVDTNIVVRFLAGDDPEQFRAARALLSSNLVWIAKTVLIETAWVLRERYGFTPAAIRSGFASLGGIENVRLEDAELTGAALALVDQGLQFPDAVHILSAPEGARFASFDQRLVQRANRAGLAHVFDPSRS